MTRRVKGMFIPPRISHLCATCSASSVLVAEVHAVAPTLASVEGTTGLNLSTVWFNPNRPPALMFSLKQDCW